MPTIAEFMTDDHKACDYKFADAEEAALTGDWDKAEAAFNTFRDEMMRHFRMEEDVLFPALKSAGGPSARCTSCSWNMPRSRNSSSRWVRR